jgi:hypothetical protein
MYAGEELLLVEGAIHLEDLRIRIDNGEVVHTALRVEAVNQLTCHS